jgi:hypothetical protein
MPLHYFLDIYHRPQGDHEPVLWKTTRINAQNDAEAIREAESSFQCWTERSPSLTGFTLCRIGFRRAGDRIIHARSPETAGPNLARRARQEASG